ncbi:MAG: hypothetical protein ABSG65_19445 [Bryobacteraceae bacterium]|jgi:hypothetical protein
MKSHATRRFWDLFHALPASVQALAVKNYQLWLRNPAHPSLDFHRLRGDRERYAVRIGNRYRAIGRMDPRAITWVWIGTHEEYNRLVRGE